MAVTILKLEGRLDTAAVGRMEVGFAARAGALTRDGDKAIFDLSDLTFLSSMGIRLIVTTLKQFRQRGVAFATIAPREATVQEVLRVADLTGHLNLFETEEAARAALGG
jgi:anti-anti-sigma factor